MRIIRIELNKEHEHMHPHKTVYFVSRSSSTGIIRFASSIESPTVFNTLKEAREVSQWANLQSLGKVTYLHP